MNSTDKSHIATEYYSFTTERFCCIFGSSHKDIMKYVQISDFL